MSSRAAWRLETLGYSTVSRYVGGKVDWLACGLPSAGELADEPRIGALARADVARCRLDQRVGDLDTTDGLCVVVNDAGVVLGDLRGKTLRRTQGSDPDARVEAVMNPAPATYRPNVSVHQMEHGFEQSDARRVLVTDCDGRLIGVLYRADVHQALELQHDHYGGPFLASPSQ